MISPPHGLGRIIALRSAAALACAATLAAPAAHATTVTDGSGILPTFTTDPSHPGAGDPNNPNSPDLNAIRASATYDAHNLYLSATMAGAIGLTRQASIAAGETDAPDQGVYVWGVDRGKGAAILNTPGNALGTDASIPIGGPDITFDAFIVMQDLVDGHGDGAIRFVNDDGTLDTVHLFALDASNISYAGNTIDLVVPLADLPSNGRSIGQYGFNMWPRYDSLGANTFVASFLPGDHNFTASAAPEPAAWGLMILGFGFAGATLRRRRTLMA